MSAYVVDTNVPVVANGKSSHADPDCVIACICALAKVRKSGTIVLDDGMLILREYMNKLSMSGEPGPGDMFMKWVWSIQAVSSLCEQVRITPRQDDPHNFVEFPDDAGLARFDRSDRKFVAVALASANKPMVLNAVDSDWAHCHKALLRNRVMVTFLCPQHVCPQR
ncbi:MAG: hypothetical protein NTX50_19715 [Candidatus Sumerlaeota bacterium]|nr:hypothetical protein [Candidatus Sumerlaeota bacterium]